MYKLKKMQLSFAKYILVWGLSGLHAAPAFAQSNIPLITAANEKAVIQDGEQVKLDWQLDPAAKPDIYYVNIPGKKSTVKFMTDKGALTFHTKPGKTYPFLVVLNQKDTCLVEIAAKLPPGIPQMHILSAQTEVISFPFELKGSKIYFQGQLNGKTVNIQLDLGAGTSVVNKNSSEKLGLTFSGHSTVSNTSGVNKERTSTGNALKIGEVEWTGVPLTEVSNMRADEDIIIGNGFFRDHTIEIDYDAKQVVIYNKLPAKIKDYCKLPVFYEQDRPKFKAYIVHNGKRYSFWFLFDTGRDGSMLLGEDFTGVDDHWQALEPLTMVNSRKIVRLDANIAGVTFKDLVTNAADPAKPNARPSLFGNQVLSHFNAVLDNVNGFIYLKPNGRVNEPLFDYSAYLKEMEKNKANK